MAMNLRLLWKTMWPHQSPADWRGFDLVVKPLDRRERYELMLSEYDMPAEDYTPTVEHTPTDYRFILSQVFSRFDFADVGAYFHHSMVAGRYVTDPPSWPRMVVKFDGTPISVDEDTAAAMAIALSLWIWRRMQMHGAWMKFQQTGTGGKGGLLG